jgi:predicted amidohydrolase YtcJ
VDDAMDVVRRAMPAPTRADRIRKLRAAFAQYARWGLTSVHDAGISLRDLEAYHAIVAEGPLPVRVYAMASASDPLLDKIFAKPPEIGAGDDTFTLRCIKIVDDGALGSRGARLTSPYADAGNTVGFSLVPPLRFDRIVKRAVDAGYQVAAHAIGDASTRDVLDAFARVGPTLRDKRFRVEHASMIRDDDVARFARLGVIASMQPVFVGEYSRFAEARVGAKRLPWVLRSRDVIESGATFAAGTDFPASDTGDPMATLASLVTRVGYDGTPATGWLPSQRVGIDVALRAMTSGAAYAAFEEGKSGVLAVGSRADFTVLSGDPTATPPNELHNLTVRRTIVGGRTTYSATR